jgi:glycogen synthase
MTGPREESGERPWAPQRILMTTDAQGGVWTYALELAAALAQHQVEVVLATMGAPLDAHQRAEVDRLELAVHESGERLEWMAGAWADIDRAGEWLLALADEVEPDLVHLNGYCHAALPWGRPVVVAAHSSVCAVHGCDPPPEWDEYRRRVIEGLGAADRVVAVSRALLAAIEEVYCPLPRAQVIPIGRDPAAMRPGRKQPYIFSAGRLWDEAKNLAALDRAAPEVPWPIHVAGEAHQLDGREVRPRHLSVLGRLPAPELAEWMECAAIFAAPARYEPFGVAALEAGLAGCALVLADIPSLREVWGDAAVFVPPEDAIALGSALRELVSDSSKRSQMARLARVRALTYDPERMAASYLALYRELAVDAADTGAFRAIREIAASTS